MKIVAQDCKIKTSLNFFLLFNPIKNLTSAITTAMIISADTNENPPHNKKSLYSTKVENGDIIAEKHVNKHSINKPLNKPTINGEIKRIIFFIKTPHHLYCCIFITDKKYDVKTSGFSFIPLSIHHFKVSTIVTDI